MVRQFFMVNAARSQVQQGLHHLVAGIVELFLEELVQEGEILLGKGFQNLLVLSGHLDQVVVLLVDLELFEQIPEGGEKLLQEDVVGALEKNPVKLAVFRHEGLSLPGLGLHGLHLLAQILELLGADALDGPGEGVDLQDPADVQKVQKQVRSGVEQDGPGV